MKKLTILLLLFTSIGYSQIRFVESEYFTVKTALGYKQAAASIELISNWKYINANLEFKKDATTVVGGFGTNLTNGYFDESRFFAGFRLGVQDYQQDKYPLVGLETGYEYSPKSAIIGFKLVSDFRSNQQSLLNTNSAYIVIGFKF
jgi:hypothetical protein